MPSLRGLSILEAFAGVLSRAHSPNASPKMQALSGSYGFVAPPTLSIRTLEDSLYGAFDPADDNEVVFDLSRAKWIESPSLLYLIALVTYRVRRALPTRMLLPTDARVIQFLQAWRFPEGLHTATGRTLNDFAAAGSHNLLDKSRERANPYFGIAIDTPFGVERLHSKYYFEIQSFQQQSELFGPSFALDEATKWKRMSLVLQTVLNGPSGLLPSRIIYEALVNAIRHPAAKTIQVVSHVQRQQGEIPGEFTVTFWDDGQAIADTLRAAAKRGMVIKPAFDLDLRATYSVAKVAVGERNAKGPPGAAPVLTSNDVPDSNSSEDRFLLASVYPGTTSKPHDFVPTPVELNDARGDKLTQPGMGLYLLVNAAVSVFGGIVEIRSGHWNLTLSPADGPDVYRATMRHLKNWPPFLGNLISITLPLLNTHPS